jgi:hypothetical protein
VRGVDEHVQPNAIPRTARGILGRARLRAVGVHRVDPFQQAVGQGFGCFGALFVDAFERIGAAGPNSSSRGGGGFFVASALALGTSRCVDASKTLGLFGSLRTLLERGDKILAKARKLLVMEGASDWWAGASEPEALRAVLRERIGQLSPLGKNFASMCPRSQQAEFVAKILAKPFDAERPDLDMAQRLGETLKVNCARLERKNIFERKFSSFASKATKSLIEDPMRAIRALGEWVGSSKSKQSMDFDSALERLSKASGGIEAMGWRGLVANRPSRMEVAQSRFEADAKASGSDLGGSSDSATAILPTNAADGLGRLAMKVRASRESVYASGNPGPKSPNAPTK